MIVVLKMTILSLFDCLLLLRLSETFLRSNVNQVTGLDSKSFPVQSSIRPCRFLVDKCFVVAFYDGLSLLAIPYWLLRNRLLWLASCINLVERTSLWPLESTSRGRGLADVNPKFGVAGYDNEPGNNGLPSIPRCGSTRSKLDTDGSVNHYWKVRVSPIMSGLLLLELN